MTGAGCSRTLHNPQTNERHHAAQVFNNWNPDSELETRINTPDRPDKIAVSEDLAKVLQVSADLVRVTGGRFDPTVMPVMRLWRRLLNDESRPPRQDEIDRYKFAVGWSRNVEMTRKAGGGAIVSLPNTLSRLDLGAVAKGYAIDLIAERFLSRGWSSWVIEWGGDVRANGAHPAGRPWRTCLIAPPDMNPLFACWTKDRLADCLNPKDMVAKINLSGMAAATSGDYFQVGRRLGMAAHLWGLLPGREMGEGDGCREHERSVGTRGSASRQ